LPWVLDTLEAEAIKPQKALNASKYALFHVLRDFPDEAVDPGREADMPLHSCKLT
jgi:hypothetical protein